MQIETTTYHPADAGLLFPVSIQRGRRFILNLSRLTDTPYERFLEPGYWARHEHFLRPDDIVLVTAEQFTLEIALGDPGEHGGFATKLISAQWHTQPEPRS
jgi:hypothetical protein